MIKTSALQPSAYKYSNIQPLLHSCIKNLFCIYLFSTSTFLFGQSEWELKKDAEGIKVYTRTVEGSKFKEYKALASYKIPASNILSVLKDPDHFEEWMPDTKANIIKREGEKLQIHYVLSNAPWPVKDRDGIYQFQYSKTANGDFLIDMECLPDYQAKVSGKVRVPYGKGFWRLSPQANGETKVHYQFHAKPGGNIPAWLANYATVSVPFKAMKALKSQVLKEKYMGQEFSF